ncbi:general substrate transporter [Talaromyces proteolyticus]|uniref:General substrate transporter n=1 Tax=Talaromyces proteolyticus TaxID=1131652 RepID=A0AAD4KQ02_9EURO|nr:general substrate transporter [Talaromyces proteolyticus]KAH8693584.1 general substrate transporter [Talaromyces proteolyticus]
MANLTGYNILISCIAAIGGYSYGYGASGFATSIGQPGFFEYFDLDPGSTYTANILGAINALFYFGLAVGSVITGWLADVIGRKKTFGLAATLALIGSALVTGSAAIAMLIVVRIIQGIGLGMLLCVVPLYLTEIAPPHRRGMIAGLTTVSFTTGYGICAWVSVGTYYAKSPTVQWRLPLGLTCVGPALILAGLYFIPESPRYLTLIGKNDEAWQVLQKIHHDPYDPEDSAAHAEHSQIVRQIAFDKELDTGWIQMLTKPSWRRRCLLAFFIQFASQSAGILGIANFITIIFSNLGMTGVMPLLLYAILTTVGEAAVILSMFIIDRVGRRTLFLIGFPLSGCVVLIEALLQWKYLDSSNETGLRGAVAMIYVYFFVFCTCVDVTAFVWMSEIFPTTIRSRGISIGFFAYFVGAITYTTPAALQMKTVKYNIFYLYMALCFVSTAIIYFFVPETKQIPIEEIGALFGDEVVVHLTEDGRAIKEDLTTKQGTQVVESHYEEKVALS